jgi:hypothetical protein
MRVAYATAEACGQGHAVRGVALVRAAARAGIELRAFGPPKPDVAGGYDGTIDWRDQLVAFAPELLLADVGWSALSGLRAELGIPGWILLRWTPAASLRIPGIERWERRISIEPAADLRPQITDRIEPVVVDGPRFRPADGAELRAGYNTWWEATLFGYRDRVRWIFEPAILDRAERMRVGGEMTRNGADVLMGMLA